MLSTAAGRIEVRGDTNASFRNSRLPISIFEWISIFGDFQALYESPTRTLTSLAVLVSFLHCCACGCRCCGFISLTDRQNSFQWGGLQASHPGITESIPVRGMPKSSEGDMSPPPSNTTLPVHPPPFHIHMYEAHMPRSPVCELLSPWQLHLRASVPLQWLDGACSQSPEWSEDTANSLALFTSVDYSLNRINREQD